MQRSIKRKNGRPQQPRHCATPEDTDMTSARPCEPFRCRRPTSLLDGMYAEGRCVHTHKACHLVEELDLFLGRQCAGVDRELELDTGLDGLAVLVSCWLLLCC